MGPLGGWLPAKDAVSKLDTKVEAESLGSLAWDLAKISFFNRRLGNNHLPLSHCAALPKLLNLPIGSMFCHPWQLRFGRALDSSGA